MERAIAASSSSAGGEFSDDGLCSGVGLRSILALAPMSHAEAGTPLPPLPACLGLDHVHEFGPSPSSLGFSPSIFNLTGGEGGGESGDRLVENESTRLYDFFPKVSGDSPPLFDKLPDLNSLEHSDLARFESETLESVVRSSLRLPTISASSSSDLTAGPSSASVAARNRRRKVTEKLQSLQKLMPGSKKMEAATLLEEVLKYVKFLESQVVALRSMPRESSLSFDPPPIAYGRRFGGVFGSTLEEVKRRRLLEILVNSSETQSVLYSRELCVFSAEQLLAVTASQPVARSVPYYNYRY